VAAVSGGEPSHNRPRGNRTIIGSEEKSRVQVTRRRSNVTTKKTTARWSVAPKPAKKKRAGDASYITGEVPPILGGETVA